MIGQLAQEKVLSFIIIREMQIETELRFYLTAPWTAKIRKT